MYRSWTSHKSSRAGLGKNTYRLLEGTLRLLAKASQSSRIHGWVSNRRLSRRATWQYWNHVEVELTFRYPIAHKLVMRFGSRGRSPSRAANWKAINQVCLIQGAAKRLRRRLFVHKNRSDPRQPLFCLAACVVEQDRVHAQKRR